MAMVRLAALACGLLLCGLALEVQAAATLKEQVVGSWEPEKAPPNGKASIEFLKDGKLKMRIEVQDQKIEIDGSYKFTADDSMELEMTFNGQTKKETIKLAIAEDVMTTTDSKGKVEKFKRIKQ